MVHYWDITPNNILYVDGSGLSIIPTEISVFRNGELEGIRMFYNGNHFDFINKEKQRFGRLYKYTKITRY